ncbi:MAG: ribbon-helix-helix domain-containing protein [Promethearchaeota archaeon]
MPIISFNISDSLKRFLKRMVSNQEYKNNSYVMRHALIRLMNEKDGDGTGTAALSSPEDFESFLPDLTASILITYKKFTPKLEKKLTRLEILFHRSILNKFVFVHQGTVFGNYVVENNMTNIQDFITELNAMEELQSFRYVINEPEN